MAGIKFDQIPKCTARNQNTKNAYVENQNTHIGSQCVWLNFIADKRIKQALE